MNILEINNVSKNYGNLHVLKEMQLSVSKGEWVAIMGPSGSGKSTLLNIIGCMDTPSKGSIKINGIETSQLNKKQLTELRRETIGLVFQQFHLIPHLTALENVMLAQYYHSIHDEKEAIAALNRVGLGDRLHHLPSQLSGGEQQRVCIARALINYPAIIIADEPTGNLDDENEQIIMNVFRQLHQEGHTIIMVTHDKEVAENAQRTVMFEYGRIIKVIVNTIYA
ncbi:ABC transporter ATP-binding protein [Neobacillus niacini]|uniref:ABC transporter ATP-binding protein n=1 Tax=Neobacillus niacini TaxID=86668 RepID=UPI0028614E93|nr:ABC transporter ATP-binding protein [Neobacillus niacini]MDR6999497.1 putative ABC transport system ATP-binding protein [Neobacillus niacini]